MDFGDSMHMVSKTAINSAELKTMKSPATVMTATGEVQTKGHGICQRIGRIRHSYASWKYSGSSFTRETLRGSWVYLPLDQRWKTTSHQKWQENGLQYIELCSIRSPWFISEFFLNHTSTYFSIIYITGFRISCQQMHLKSSIRKKWKYECE